MFGSDDEGSKFHEEERDNHREDDAEDDAEDPDGEFELHCHDEDEKASSEDGHGEDGQFEEEEVVAGQIGRTTEKHHCDSCPQTFPNRKAMIKHLLDDHHFETGVIICTDPKNLTH